MYIVSNNLNGDVMVINDIRMVNVLFGEEIPNLRGCHQAWFVTDSVWKSREDWLNGLSPVAKVELAKSELIPFKGRVIIDTYDQGTCRSRVYTDKEAKHEKSPVRIQDGFQRHKISGARWAIEIFRMPGHKGRAEVCYDTTIVTYEDKVRMNQIVMSWFSDFVPWPDVPTELNLAGAACINVFLET